MMIAQATPVVSSAGPSVLDWITLGLAGAGFTLAVLALCWQIASVRLTGSFVTVSVGSGRMFGVGPGVKATAFSALFMTVYNRGRIPVSVENWGY